MNSYVCPALQQVLSPKSSPNPITVSIHLQKDNGTERKYIRKKKSTFQSNFRVFSPSPKEILYSLVTLPTLSLSSPWKLLIDSLWLWVCLFETFYINEIIDCMVFCDYLLPFSMFLRSIHVVACITTSLLVRAP